jgi:hypothetical protein
MSDESAGEEVKIGDCKCAISVTGKGQIKSLRVQIVQGDGREVQE